MTARIDKPAFLSARSLGWICLILSGVGIVSVAERLPDLFEDADAQSCRTCQPALRTPTPALSDIASEAGSCAAVATKQEPTFVVTNSILSTSEPMLVAWRASLHSAVLQSDPQTWDSLQVSF